MGFARAFYLQYTGNRQQATGIASRPKEIYLRSDNDINWGIELLPGGLRISYIS